MSVRDRFRIRALALGLVLTAGCAAAALLHILLSWESGLGFGPGLSHEYAHIVVMPLLSLGICGSLALGLWRAIHSRDVRALTSPPFLLRVLVASVCAAAIFAAGEYLEAFVAFGYRFAVQPEMPFGATFVLQLSLLVTLIVALVDALLRLCFRVVAVVEALFGYRSPHAVVPLLRAPRALHAPQITPRHRCAGFGRRAPPQLPFV